MICDDVKGRHWAMLANGHGDGLVTWKKDFGNFMNGWCGHAGSRSTWADVDGDGKADLICDDTNGNHWLRTMNGIGGVKKDYGRFQGGWCSHAGSYT